MRTRPKATPAIAWRVPEEPLTYPVRLDERLLDARAAVSGAFSFSPPRDSLLDVGTHSIEAAFEPQDRKNYLQAAATQTITVVKGTPQIVWKPRETELTFGTEVAHLSLTYIHTHIHDIHSYIYTCIHTYIHAYIHIYTYIHTYILYIQFIHTHTYILIHTCMYRTA